MNHHHLLRRSFIGFHLILGLVVAVQSLQTLLRAIESGGAQHANLALACLAGAEMIAALLFLLPATLKVGATALLVIFIFAIAFHGLHGEVQSSLLVYAAGVALVMAHGSGFGKGRMDTTAAA
jgi:uncharacterized membrane protein YphA (DoxX/SURF4 family)